MIPPPQSPTAAAPDQPTPPPASSAARGRGDRVRLALWIIAALALAVGLPAWFYLIRDGLIVERLPVLHRGWMGLAAACVVLWALLTSTPATALRLSPRFSKRILILVSALLSAAALYWLVPVLSTEPLRYRFDGHIWLLGMNPYQVSPGDASELAAEQQDLDLRPDALDRAAPSPGRTTLNLPVSQAAFVAARSLEYLFPQPAAPPLATSEPSSDWRAWMLSLPDWRQLLFWRCMLAGAFLLAVGEIIAWLRYRELSPWWAAVFAWQPLVLVESLGAGHQDMLGVMFLVAGLRRADMGNYRRAAICLAASVAVKPWALLILPFMISRAWRGDPPDWERPLQGSAAAARRAMVWFLAAIVLLMTPVWIGGGIFELARALADFFASAEHDGALYRLLETMFIGPDASAQRVERVRLAAWVLCGLATVAAGLIAWLRRVRPPAAFYAMSMAALLASPVISPWALIWPLAIVPVLRGRAGPAALIWAGTAVLSYTAHTLSGGRLAAQGILLQMAPVYVVAVTETLVTSRHAARYRRRRVAERVTGHAVAPAAG